MHSRRIGLLNNLLVNKGGDSALKVFLRITGILRVNLQTTNIAACQGCLLGIKSAGFKDLHPIGKLQPVKVLNIVLKK